MRYEGIGAAIEDAGYAVEGWDGCIREGWGLIEGAGYCDEGWHYRPKNDD